jgi:hypothetical protein
MAEGDLRVGAYTHTARILGYCGYCALYHESDRTAALCRELSLAKDDAAEMQAWRALKAALAVEQGVGVSAYPQGLLGRPHRIWDPDVADGGRVAV